MSIDTIKNLRGVAFVISNIKLILALIGVAALSHGAVACKFYGMGKASILDDIKLKAAKNKVKKAESLNNATNAKQKRDIENEAKAQALQEVIDEAVANDENALDAIF